MSWTPKTATMQTIHTNNNKNTEFSKYARLWNQVKMHVEMCVYVCMHIANFIHNTAHRINHMSLLRKFSTQVYCCLFREGERNIRGGCCFACHIVVMTWSKQCKNLKLLNLAVFNFWRLFHISWFQPRQKQHKWQKKQGGEWVFVPGKTRKWSVVKLESNSFTPKILTQLKFHPIIWD